MNADASHVHPDFSFDHPLYRMAHLHGNRWVTFKPAEQHNPSEDDPGGPWANGVVYRCTECDESVVLAPA